MSGRTLWVARYNGPGSNIDIATSVAISPDGSKVFVTGYAAVPGFSDDYATLAYDAATGAKLWLKHYDGGGRSVDHASSIAVTRDGSKVFVTGASVAPGSSHSEYGTVAYDSSTGAKLWAMHYAGSGGVVDYASCIAVSPDGSKVFVTGTSFGTYTGYDYATVAYDASAGAMLWVQRYNGPKNDADLGYSDAVSPDGSKVFVTGGSKGAGSSYDYATVAYGASTGSMLWLSRYNGPGNSGDIAKSVATNPDGSKVFVTGGSVGSRNFSDYASVAYDASTGAKYWIKRFDGPGFATSVATSPEGSRIFVTGSSFGVGGSYDYGTVAYDVSTGATLWAMHYDGEGREDDAISVGVSPDGSKVFVTGTSFTMESGSDYATLAYDASTGAKLWVKRFNSSANDEEDAYSLAVSPDGSKVFVTGDTFTKTSFDYATLAYAA